ncbi:unnamed protein product [Scytosiphon promiscuus]
MLSGGIIQAPILLLPMLSATCVDAQGFAAAVVTDATLIHGGAFTEQIDLVDPDVRVEHLALTDRDVRYKDVTVDGRTGDVYFATSNSSIRRARYDSAIGSPTWEVATVIGGRVEVYVEGYNLGASAEDIVYFAIRGVECRTLRRDSSNSLVCVLGDPTVADDLGKGIGPEDIVVQTAIGGWTQGGYPGDFVDAKLADHSLKPIISRVEVNGHIITPSALCFDEVRGYLYYSDHGTRSIERIRLVDHSGDGSAPTTELDFDAFLPDVGRVQGIAIDGMEGPNGGYLYFSESELGTVSRVELPDDGSRPPLAGAKQVLASGLIDPTDIALEPNGGTRLFFVLRGGSIRAVMRDGSVSTAVPSTAILDGGGYEVRRCDSGTRLEGIAISEDGDSIGDPIQLRLYWIESGRTAGIKRSTLDGTRPEKISVLDDNGQEARLIWPRGLVFGAGSSAGLLFCEYLGSVKLLPYPDEGRAQTVVAEDSYPAAKAIQVLIATADGEGVTDRFFTQSVR